MFKNKEEHHSLNESIRYDGVCRAAPGKDSGFAKYMIEACKDYLKSVMDSNLVVTES